MKRFTIVLVAAALIAAMAGCNPTPIQYHRLTISSTVGGNVTRPGEGNFTYQEGTVVDLVAEAEGGYRFVKWTGSTYTIADVSTAATTIIISGNYSITANFGTVIEIEDWSDLDAIRDNPDGFYLLMNNLDSSTPGYEELAGPAANGGKGWQPIGIMTEAFTGAFDGQGHQIYDLYIDRPDEINVGLFGVNFGVVRDTGVVNAGVIGAGTVGGLVGWNAGTVSRCYYSGGVTGAELNSSVGGLVGTNQGGVIASYSTGNVTGNDGVGGLLGQQYAGGVVTDCYSASSVAGAGGVGGLAGMVQASIVRGSYSMGGVSGKEQSVGGLLGSREEAVVDRCFWDINTSGQAKSAGGTGKITAQMKSIATFSGATWNITAVAEAGARNAAYIWNIVDGMTYPFLSWQHV
jgi:hypothetical protein